MSTWPSVLTAEQFLESLRRLPRGAGSARAVGSTIEASIAKGQVRAALADEASSLLQQVVGAAQAAPTRPPAPYSTMPLGVDFSDHQGIGVRGVLTPRPLADFQRLRRLGKVFAVLKASQRQAETTFPGHYQRAREAGLIRGSYHLFTGRPVAEQAHLLLGLVPRVGPGELAPSLDVEDPTSKNLPLFQHYHYRHGKQGNAAGTNAVLNDLQDWLDRVEAALGRTPLIYTGVMWRDDFQSPRMSQYPLWTLPSRFPLGGWASAEIWQYAEDGGKWLGVQNYHEPGVNIPGIDFDAYNGTMYGLRGLADCGRVGVAHNALGDWIAHSELNAHIHLLNRPSARAAWADRDLMAGSLPSVGDDPVMLAQNQALLLYFRSDGRVIEAALPVPTATWDVTDLSQVAGVNAFQDPRAVVDADKRYVVFSGEDDDWHLLVRDTAGTWTVTHLLWEASHSGTPPPPLSSGQPSLYLVQGSAHPRIVGRAGPLGHLFEVTLRNTGWEATDLTGASTGRSGTPPAATYSPAFYSTNTETFIVYRAIRGEIWQIARGALTAENVTSLVPGSRLAQGHPTCFVVGGRREIVYRGVDKAIHELAFHGATWTANRLPCTVQAASDPTSVSDGTTALVAFRAVDGVVHVLRFDGNSWTCTETVRAAVEEPPRPAGPQRGRGADVVVVEDLETAPGTGTGSGGTGTGTAVPPYGGYDLRFDPAASRTDSDAAKRWGGAVHAAPDLLPAAGQPGFVRQLKQDLRTLGFKLVDNTNGVFDRRTFWAIREFQIYAAQGDIAQEAVGGGAGRYVDRLTRTANPQRYTGHVSGVVNAETRTLLQIWITNHLRCPVVVDALLADAAGNFTIVRAENIWDRRDYPHTDARMFARDFTSQYAPFPAGHNLNEQIVLGDFAVYHAWSGPSSEHGWAHWATAEMTPETLAGAPAGAALNTLDPRVQSCYRVIRAVAEVECHGFFDEINAYDDVFVSQGPFHNPIGEANETHGGELCGVLAEFLANDPAGYERAFGRFGIRPKKAWGANGLDLINTISSRRFMTTLTLSNEAGGFDDMDLSAASLNMLRAWHWFYRFEMAGRTIDRYWRAIWRASRARLRAMILTNFGQGVANLPHSSGTGSRPATIWDLYTSERALALILRWHVRFPAHMVSGFVAGPRLNNAFRRARVGGRPPAAWGPPYTWTDAHEQALIDGLMDEVTTLGNTGLRTTMTTVLNFAGLDNTRGSFYLDGTDLGAVV